MTQPGPLALVGSGEFTDTMLATDGALLDAVEAAGFERVVAVIPTAAAPDGDVVVAMVGEEATVKRFFRESDHVRLQPENAAMEPIRSREVRVLGRVVGLFRSMP